MVYCYCIVIDKYTPLTPYMYYNSPSHLGIIGEAPPFRKKKKNTSISRYSSVMRQTTVESFGHIPAVMSLQVLIG
mgnify:CR=1 FL=1